MIDIANLNEAVKLLLVLALGQIILDVIFIVLLRHRHSADVPTKVIHVHITVNALDYCKKVEAEVWKAIRRAGCM